MDIKLGLSIFNQQWAIEPNAAGRMLDFYESVRRGEATWNYREANGTISSYEIHNKFFAQQDIVMAPESSYDMREFKGFDGAKVAIIPITGPIMKNDYCGAFGTSSLANLTKMASNTASVEKIIYLIDSPGGMVSGTEAFASVIKQSTKQTIGLITGSCCSAAYWLGSSCDMLYASSKSDEVGSIGTMAQFRDNTEAMKQNGVVIREYYASKSEDKNKAFSEARNGDGKLLIQEYLDPTNDIFLNSVKENRAGRLNLQMEDTLTGKVYLAEDATRYGLIDGIASLDDLWKQNNFYQKNSKQTVMTAENIKGQHPEAYAAIVKEATNAERDRVNSWMVFADVDLKMVSEGIKDGSTLTTSQITELTRKQFSKEMLTSMEKESDEVGAKTTPEPDNKTLTQSADEASLKENKAALFAALNIK